MTTPDAPARPRRWVGALALAWGLLLAGGIGWAVAYPSPTSREQTTVAEAEPVVERATAEVATAATADGLAVVGISGFDRVGECNVTILRSGEHYQRVVTATVAPGTEEALMERVAARLPAAYGATVRKGAAPRLTADAGFWVGLTGSISAPGRVRFVADTGACRPLGDVATVDDGDGDRSAVEAVLMRLGVQASQWSVFRAACPGGGSLATVEAVGADGSRPGHLDQALRDAFGGGVVVSMPELYAYRTGATGVAVRADDAGLVVTATTPCP